ncbi:MAG: lipid A deacylase LpxR family protein [Gammaproteobacteria bacterium]|jgi:hypothetical protein|nr:lipid A deacylase LpxR family protein [Gammaproteobacteria bacterium]
MTRVKQGGLKLRYSLLLIYFLVEIIQNPAYAGAEKYNTGWQLNIDNNIFQRYMKDRDYTAGVAFTAFGSRAQSGWLNIDPVRAWIFNFLPINDINRAQITKHSVQYGLALFTPDNITATQPIIDDRPFASLFYISNTELTVQPSTNRAYRSSLSFGLLGLEVAGDIQRVLHQMTGSEEANGWNNQVSAGGEPTAMLTLSVQQKQSASDNYQLSSHLEANAGYSTDVNAGLNWRWGRLNTPWWSFDPSHYEYIASAAVSERGIAGSKPEFYIFAGANIKYRFYSSLLQGQFRDSAHTLGHDQLEQAIASLTAGATREFGDNLRVSLFVRGTSPEITGGDARNLWWASLAINRAW